MAVGMMRPGHAIVSGGSSGIGLALSRRLAASGWSLTIIARDLARLEAAREELTRAGGGEVHLESADVADSSAIEAAVGRAIQRLGPPGLVVASAGTAQPGYFEDLPLEVFERAMAVNYFGTLHLVRAALPAMRAERSGRIVLIGSGAGLVGLFGYAAYSPSKFALRGLAEALRAELRPAGVGVSIVYPPDTDTPQLAAENETKPAETRAITKAGGVMRPEAVANAIVKGIERGRFSITPGWEMTLLAPLAGPLAPLLRNYFDRLARRGARIGSKKPT